MQFDIQSLERHMSRKNVNQLEFRPRTFCRCSVIHNILLVLYFYRSVSTDFHWECSGPFVINPSNGSLAIQFHLLSL